MKSSITPVSDGTSESSTAPISQQINTCIYISFVLSSGILVCSLVLYGIFSFWLSEDKFRLTVIHHSIVRHDKRKRRKSREEIKRAKSRTISSTLSQLIHKAHDGFISLAYTAAFGLVLAFVIFVLNWSLEANWESHHLASVAELIFMFEIAMMGMIARCCMRERRLGVVLKATESDRWYHLLQHNRY